MRNFILALSFALAVGLFGELAVAADDYPSRPVKIVVGIAPGGITDVTTRIYADAVSKQTGQNFVVEDRPGGGGGLRRTLSRVRRPMATRCSLI